MSSIPQGFKMCSKPTCKQPLKPIDSFSKDKNRKDGRCPYCRACWSKNPEKAAQRSADRALLHQGLKRCGTCEQVKELAEFCVKAGRWDGRNWQCRMCDSTERRAAYQSNPEAARSSRTRWRTANIERARQSERAAYAADPARAAGKKRAWRELNTEKARLAAQKWKQGNPEKEAAGRRAWLKANPEKNRANGHRARARRHAAPGHFTAEQFRATCTFYGDKCLRCGKADIPLTADHIVPLARGGSNDIGNIQPLCLSCNSSKGNRVIIDYRPDKGAHFAPKQAALFG